MPRATPVMTAALALAVVASGAPTASAADVEPSTVTKTRADAPFHYARGDHLKGTAEHPTTSRYGSGRPVFLVGDSMAGQLSDGLLQVTRSDRRALLPRTKSAAAFRLPGATTTDDGRWSERIHGQIKAEARAGRRPIVVLAALKLGTSPQIRGTVWRLRKAGATVYLATSSPRPVDVANIPGCVLRSSRPNTYCRYRVEDFGPGRWATLKAAREARPAVPALDMRPLVARGKGPTYAPVHTGKSGPVQVYRGAGSHVTATWSREVLRRSLAQLVR